jgi:hypothetical protein
VSAHEDPDELTTAPLTPATPFYPTMLPLPAGNCPDGTHRLVGAFGWTCALPADYDQALAYLAAERL